MGLIQKTVYIRQEDLPAWNGLANKAAFIHSALEDYNGVRPVGPQGFAKVTDNPKTVNEVKETFGSVVKFCKHGYDPKYCRYAKNGKPCK